MVVRLRGERVELAGEAVIVAAGMLRSGDSAAETAHDATLDVPGPRGQTLTIDSAGR